MELKEIGELLNKNQMSGIGFNTAQELAKIKDNTAINKIIEQTKEIYEKDNYIAEYILIMANEIIAPLGMKGFDASMAEIKYFTNVPGYGGSYAREFGFAEPSVMLLEKSPKLLNNFEIEGYQTISNLAKKINKDKRKYYSGNGRIATGIYGLFTLGASLKVNEENRTSKLQTLEKKVKNMLEVWDDQEHICLGCARDYWEHSSTHYPENH